MNLFHVLCGRNNSYGLLTVEDFDELLVQVYSMRKKLINTLLMWSIICLCNDVIF